MATYAYQITKTRTFRGSQERFSNVYNFEHGAVALDETLAKQTAEAIAAKEKEFHGSGVQFVEWACWGPLHLPKEQRLMIADGPLTGAGALTAGTQLPAEGSVVFQWYLGRNAKGHRNRFLRKFYHVGMMPTANQTNAANQESQIAAADITFYTGKANDLKNLAVGTGTVQLVAPDGDNLPLGTNPEILKYVRTRQLKYHGRRPR